MGVSRDAMEVRDASAGYKLRAEKSSMPVGYKQTEVGVIPDDWDVRSIYDIAERQKSLFDDGDWVEAEHITNKGVRLIQTGNIGIGCYVEKSIKKYIYETSFEKLKCKELTICDLLICRLAEPAGRACLLPDLGEGKVITSVDVTIFRPSEKVADRRFLVQYFSTRDWFESVLSNVGGTTHQRISRGALGKIPVPFPPVDEQRAIATALSDVDALLEGLDRLIAKKRDLKQAAMQQLLTGQTRLPGFGGEWKTMRLGDNVTFLRNGVNARAELTKDGPVKYLHYGDIHAHRGSSMSPGDLPSLPIQKAKGLGRLADGDLVFADASEDLDGVGKSVEIQNVGDAEVVAGLHTIAARFDKNILADGFKAYLQFCPSFIRHLRKLAAGTKVYATNRAHVASAEMALPSVDEQTAIATVFSDMDAELEAMEQRRAKTAALKQAMMQELLTGRTRLVEPEHEETAAC